MDLTIFRTKASKDVYQQKVGQCFSSLFTILNCDKIFISQKLNPNTKDVSHFFFSLFLHFFFIFFDFFRFFLVSFGFFYIKKPKFFIRIFWVFFLYFFVEFLGFF